MGLIRAAVLLGRSRRNFLQAVHAGRILEGASVEGVGREIFERLIALASGEPSLSEAQGIGEEEFNPWILGATM